MQINIESSVEASVEELALLIERFESFRETLLCLVHRLIDGGTEHFPVSLSEPALGTGNIVSQLAVGGDVELVVSALRALNLDFAHNILSSKQRRIMILSMDQNLQKVIEFTVPQASRDEVRRGLREINMAHHKKVEEIISKQQQEKFVEILGEPLK